MSIQAIPTNTILDKQNPQVLVVDDIRDNVTMLAAHLKNNGYETIPAYNGVDALKIAINEQPDLIMLDVNMPQLSGLDVCVQLKSNPKTEMIPVILVTAHSEASEVVKGFEAGADDYLIKPYNYLEMIARVRSMIRIRNAQMQLLEANRQLDELNKNLEEKVQLQVEELEKVNRLRRFFSPQIVDIVAENADILSVHRREITVVFVDLRNFTAFAAMNEPRVIIQTVRDLHAVVGPIIFKYRGTLERFTGDGLMVFLGDPEPMPDHPMQAIKMCIEIRDAVSHLTEEWLKQAYNLKLGLSAATGEASLGTIGFEGRYDYAAIGNVTNLSARLCSLASGGQILVSETTKDQLDESVEVRLIAEKEVKGFAELQKIYEIV